MKFSAKKYIFLFFLLTIIAEGRAFAFSIRGSVVDIKGSPVSFATIFIRELNKGITTGESGTFVIPVDEGTYHLKFQCVGYQPELRTVIMGNKDAEIKVVLKEMNYTLNEVVISGRENPANRIMRATITRSQFFFKLLESYTADVYVKVNFKIDKLSALVKYMTRNEKDIPKVGKLQFAESHNLVNYVAPDHYTQKVLKVEKSALDFGPEGVPGVEFLTYSVYKPKYGEIASPLGRNAFSYYNFYLSGISVMGNYSIYKIKFSPKRPGIFFDGFIYINSNNYFVNNLEWNLSTSFQKYKLKMDFDVFQDVIALPSSYYLNLDFDIMGNKVSGMSSSSLRYTALKVNEKARLYGKEEKNTEPESSVKMTARQNHKQKKLENEMNKLMEKKEMSLQDMNKFMRTLKKLDKATEPDTTKSLEVKDPVMLIKDSLYNKHDTLYWRQVRPIELSLEEKVAEHEIDSVYKAKLADSSSIKPKKDTTHKGLLANILDAVFLGRNLSKDSLSEVHVSGLLSNNTYFTSVDGFTLGTTFSFQNGKMKNSSYFISLTPSYSFSRHELMSEGRLGRTFSKKKQASLFLDIFSKSRDINPQYPVDLFLNSLSSLFLFDNKVVQLHDQGCRITGKMEITNGLVARLVGEYHNRELLSNTTNYSFSGKDSIYKPNIPVNLYQSTRPLIDYQQILLQFGLQYTPRNKYMLRKDQKINLGSDFPTFGFNFIKGLCSNLSKSDFERIAFSIDQKINLGLLSEIWYKATAGNSYHTGKLQQPDFYQPNVTALAFDFRDTKNSFLLLPSYVYSTPSWFVDAHFRYNASCLLVKYIPWVGKKLFTETITLAYYHTEKYPHYVEAAYGFGNILFAGSVQAVVGYADGKYAGWGLRAFFSIK